MGLRRLALAALGASVLSALPGASSAVAAGVQTIAVVVDLGSGAPLILCVTEPLGTNDGQPVTDLAALDDGVGSMNVRLATSGLLCAIDGQPPAPACGTQVGSHYQYWAYFHGTSSGWHYASDGPGEQLASASSAVGLRFEVDGTGSSSDSPPGTPADPAALCPPPTSAASPTATSPSPVVAVTSPTTMSAPAPGGSATTTTLSTSVTARVAQGSARKEALRPVGGSASSSGSSPVGPLAALALFVLLGGGAGLLWRRRRHVA